ncbi:MAG: helix-turn-helix domain-containing protein [Pseudomonadota bacterium]
MTAFYKEIQQKVDRTCDNSKAQLEKAVVHKFSPLEVKKIRSNLAMSQTQFAFSFGISVSTLRHWERGDRTPQGPALVLLNVVAKNPRAVLNALVD